MIFRFYQWLRDWWRGNTFGATRSSDWGKFRKDYEKTHPKICPICGSKKCQLHHKESFATHPEKEKDPNNVRWLCDGWGTLQHHRGIGHLGNFQSINENLDEDIKIWKEKFETRPKWNGLKWIYKIIN